MTGASPAVAASVYDAIYTSVGERLGVPVQDVADALVHREVPDDSFWPAWDDVVNAATDLFERVREGETAVTS